MHKDGIPLRATFIVDPEGIIRFASVNDLSVGRNVDDHCFTVDVPNQPMDITGSDGLNTRWNLLNSQGEGACRAVTSWMNNLDFRLNGSIPIKGGFNASFIFRNTVGATEDAFIQAVDTAIERDE